MLVFLFWVYIFISIHMICSIAYVYSWEFSVFRCWVRIVNIPFTTWHFLSIPQIFITASQENHINCILHCTACIVYYSSCHRYSDLSVPRLANVLDVVSICQIMLFYSMEYIHRYSKHFLLIQDYQKGKSKIDIFLLCA